ncbi:MAG: tetratricopeptide repeat protein [Bacteroidetes bacterium]|nr:MAG: tetratricopeptide repeat protein [Bacteroidota bacterium]
MAKKGSIVILLLLLGLLQVKYLHAQAPPKLRDSTITGPQTFAIILGISKYKYVRELQYADKDAELFHDFLKSPAGGSLSDDNIFMLLNEQAMSTNFWSKGNKWLKAKSLRDKDRLFIYLAGHGDAIDEDEFFFLTYETNPAGDKNNYLAGGSIQLYNLKSRIEEMTGKGVEVYFIMDACRSNELPGGKDGQAALTKAITQKSSGEITMLATGAGQESFEDGKIGGTGHGLFTYFLVDGLNGSADESKDKKVSLYELKSYIDKNVPSFAMTKFHKKQEPYICCPETKDPMISQIDTAYLRKWIQVKDQYLKSGGNAFQARYKYRHFYEDTVLIQSYNAFNKAIKENKLTGDKSAEYYYEQMVKKYPGDPYTSDAQSTLAAEFVNVAQEKINLYLDCKDASTIQKIRSQMSETVEDEGGEGSSSLDRMEKIARQEFYEVGLMLEKAIKLIEPDDPQYAKSLTGRMYFFKARGYFGRDRKTVDIKRAFQYAYTAITTEKDAAYLMNTLSSLHMDNQRYDSSIYYALKAIAKAPKWRYPYLNLAFSYRSLAQPDLATKYYRRAIDLDPTISDAWVDLGSYYQTLNRADSAIYNYRQALIIEPKNTYATNNIGWIYMSRKKYDSAIIYFRKSITLDPKFINAYNGMSKAFIEKRQYDSARVYFDKAFVNYQDKATVNIYIGNFYKQLKEYDSAKVYYRRAILFDPNYEESYNNMGRIFFETKEYDSAKAYYRQALAVNPFSAFSLINTGLVFREQKQLDSTYSYFQKAINLEPRNNIILNNLGVVFKQDKKYDSAKSYFKRALQIRPDYLPAYNNLMRLFKELDQVDSVTNFLKDNRGFNDANSGSLNEIGLAFLDLKRYDSARTYLRKSLAYDPSNANTYGHIGLVFLRENKKLDSARIYLRKAITLDPDNTYANLNLASVFKQMNQLDSAGYYYQKQLTRRGGASATVYASVGGYFYDLKVFDSAIVYYKKALALDNSSVQVVNSIGASYQRLEQNDSAALYYIRAVQMDSTYPKAASNLGLLYHSMSKFDSAIVYLEKGVRLEPRNANLHYQLACSYALSDKKEPAVRYLQLAIDKGFKDYESLITDPDLVSLKNFKPFVDLVKKYTGQ